MRVQLFSTCLVDTFYPETAEAVVKLLRHFGCDVVYPRGQTCCGKPADSGGYEREARAAAKHFIKVFSGEEPIVVPSGSCASMVKNHYPMLLGNDKSWKSKATDLAQRVYELSQFLVHILKAHEREFRWEGSVTYHASCQLTRELGVRDEPLTLIQCIKGVEFKPMPHADRCCGFGGIFMVKQPEISMALADDKLDTIMASGANTVIGCDHGCLMNIEDAVRRRGTNIKVKHLAVLLAEALP